MLLGVENFLQSDLSRFKNKQLGLMFHTASITQNFKSTEMLLGTHPDLKLTALFGPQHGAFGDKQDNMIESDHIKHPQLKIPLYSLYSEVRKPTPDMLKNVEAVLFDLQDVGCRVYTYIHTLYLFMQAAIENNKQIIVLDRPNPLGDLIMGNKLDMSFQSFVGLTPIPMQHGMTMGELARYFNYLLGNKCDLEIIPMAGYRASRVWEEQKLPYVLPSPNLSCVQALYIYPGTVLIEGTQLSEGRGTTWPFLLLGCPKIDPFLLCENLPAFEGIQVRPYYFEPTFHKFANELCAGIQIRVSDPYKANPQKFTIEMLRVFNRLFPAQFKWRQPPYEYEEHIMPIDILTGGAETRLYVEGKSDGKKLWELFEQGERSWAQERVPFLIESYH